MLGVPSAIADGPWWWLFVFLACVVFVRAQATYGVGRWVRSGLSKVPDSPDDLVAADMDAAPSRRARLAARFSGPGWERARTFLDRWGFIGIPVSFLTIGFQTMVNAAAGFGRMRWDLYTVAMIPGCLAWAAIYSVVGFSLVKAWNESPWLFAAVFAALVRYGVGTHPAAPNRRFRFAYSSIAAHKCVRLTSGHNTSLKTYSA